MCVHFGRDHHQLLIHRFYAIRQTNSVHDYTDRFEHLTNQLLSYSNEVHKFNFLMRIIGGLRVDLRAAIMLQWPVDLNTACSLALVQEEVQDGVRPDYSCFIEPVLRTVPRIPFRLFLTTSRCSHRLLL